MLINQPASPFPLPSVESMESVISHANPPPDLFTTPFPKSVWEKSLWPVYSSPPLQIPSCLRPRPRCGSLPPAGLLTKNISTKTLEFISLPLKFTAAEQTNPLSWPFFLSMGSWLQRHFGKGLCGDSHCSLNRS